MKSFIALVFALASFSAHAQSKDASCPNIEGVFGNDDVTITVKQDLCDTVKIRTEISDDYDGASTQFITPDGVTESQDEDDSESSTVIIYSYGKEKFENDVDALIGRYEAVDAQQVHTDLPGHFRVLYYINAKGNFVIAQLADQNGVLVMNGHSEYAPKVANP